MPDGPDPIGDAVRRLRADRGPALAGDPDTVRDAVLPALEGHAVLNGQVRWVHPLVHALLDALDSPDAGPVPYLCPDAHVVIDGAPWPVTIHRHFDGTPASVTLAWPPLPTDTCPPATPTSLPTTAANPAATTQDAPMPERDPIVDFAARALALVILCCAAALVIAATVWLIARLT